MSKRFHSPANYSLSPCPLVTWSNTQGNNMYLLRKHWRLIFPFHVLINSLTHWGQVTHICVGKLTTINWTNDGILLIGSLGSNFSEILVGIQTFSIKKMHLKMSSAKWRPSCLGLNVLINQMIPWQWFIPWSATNWYLTQWHWGILHTVYIGLYEWKHTLCIKFHPNMFPKFLLPRIQNWFIT